MAAGFGWLTRLGMQPNLQSLINTGFLGFIFQISTNYLRISCKKSQEKKQKKTLKEDEESPFPRSVFLVE